MAHFRPNSAPIHYASGYSLHLYCDYLNPEHGYDEFPHEFTGETFMDCASQARKLGWKFHKATRTATCPKCVKVLRHHATFDSSRGN